MADPYLDSKKDLDQVKKMFRRLHQRKEQEITFRRLGKRMPATLVKEMREMEAAIEAIMDRRRNLVSALHKNLMETFKNQYQAQMRSWKNRLSFAERQRLLKTRPVAARDPNP